MDREKSFETATVLCRLPISNFKMWNLHRDIGLYET